MKKCPKCNEVFDDTWKVCLHCGVPLVLPNEISHIAEQKQKTKPSSFLRALGVAGATLIIGVVVIWLTSMTRAVLDIPRAFSYHAGKTPMWLSIESNKEIYANGDDILIYFILKNTSNKPAVVKFENRRYRISIVHKEGALPAGIHTTEGEMSYAPIERNFLPHEEVVYPVRLNDRKILDYLFNGKLKSVKIVAVLRGSKWWFDGKPFYPISELAGNTISIEIAEKSVSGSNKLLELNHKFAQECNERGLAYYEKCEYEQAMYEYNRAIALNPNYAEAYYDRGRVYKDKDNNNQSVLDFNKALELNPNLAQEFNSRGFDYYKKRKDKQAISNFTKAIVLNPNYAEAYYNRGSAYYEWYSNYVQSVSDFNKAIELNPNFAEAYYKRGLAHYRKREYARTGNDYDSECAKAWDDVNKAVELGFKVKPEFLKELKQASERKK